MVNSLLQFGVYIFFYSVEYEGEISTGGNAIHVVIITYIIRIYIVGFSNQIYVYSLQYRNVLLMTQKTNKKKRKK